MLLLTLALLGAYLQASMAPLLDFLGLCGTASELTYTVAIFTNLPLRSVLHQPHTLVWLAK